MSIIVMIENCHNNAHRNAVRCRSYCNNLWIRFSELSGGVLGNFFSINELDSLKHVGQ